MRTIHNSVDHFNKAKTLFPGGVNSPVRAFKSVGGTPVFITKGKGCTIEDVDGNTYVDFCCSWGPLINGHSHPEITAAVLETANNGLSFGTPTLQENNLGDLILSHHRYIDKIRFVSSGTEAVMSALRLARGFTGKTKIVKFEGCYHGHVDGLLVKAGSGLATLGVGTSAGIPKGYAEETLVLPLNDIEALEEAFKLHHKDIAGVIIEPVPANNGLLLQDKVFLKRLRELCTSFNILLIFDEVISGFRIGFEGAAGYYDIQPDIITFGKIIGGGMPVGAYGASDTIMSNISPLGAVYQAGTLSGNPIAMAAGYAQLKLCLKDGFYKTQEAKTQNFVKVINAYAKSKNYNFKLFSIASIFWLSFSNAEHVRTTDGIPDRGSDYFKDLFHYLLNNGIYLGPSGYEVGFISSAHDQKSLDKATKVICDGLDHIYTK